jgi:hypothetical protein
VPFAAVKSLIWESDRFTIRGPCGWGFLNLYHLGAPIGSFQDALQSAFLGRFLPPPSCIRVKTRTKAICTKHEHYDCTKCRILLFVTYITLTCIIFYVIIMGTKWRDHLISVCASCAEAQFGSESFFGSGFKS